MFSLTGPASTKFTLDKFFPPKFPTTKLKFILLGIYIMNSIN